jgi:hypothetical protein
MKMQKIMKVAGRFALAGMAPTVFALLLAGMGATSGCGKSQEKPHKPAFLLVQSSKTCWTRGSSPSRTTTPRETTFERDIGGYDDTQQI